MLKLGVPSKGRLQEDTISWFEKRGLILKRTGSEREYTGSISGVDGIELVLLSAGEIPQELAKGRIHLGVTGADLIYEKLPLHEKQIYIVEEMGFGFADLIIAVPNVWIDVNTLHDLDAVAAQFRSEHGFRLRIATKYHNLVRKGLRDFGVSDYQLVDSQGATEGTVANLTAEAIADITSSGATLKANHLKLLSDGVLLQSQASIFASRTADWSRLGSTMKGLCKKMDWKDLVL